MQPQCRSLATLGCLVLWKGGYAERRALCQSDDILKLRFACNGAEFLYVISNDPIHT